jgi:hypothetical protein
MPKIPPSLAKLPPSPPPSAADLRPPQPSPEAAVAPPPLAPSGLARFLQGSNLRPEWAKGIGLKKRKILHSNEAQPAIGLAAQAADVEPEPTPATSPPAPAAPTRPRAQIPRRKQRVYVSKHGEWGDSSAGHIRLETSGQQEEKNGRFNFGFRSSTNRLTAVSEAEAPLDLFEKSAPLAEQAFEALRALERFMQAQELKANARIGPRPLF